MHTACENDHSSEKAQNQWIHTI